MCTNRPGRSLTPTLILFALLALPLKSYADLKVLTYSSMLDKGGLGDEIKKSFAAKIAKLDFESSKDFAGVLGTLRRLKREGKLSQLNVVLGLNESNYTAALAEGLIQKGQPFEESSFAILVNKESFPEKLWPHTWKEAQEKLNGKLLIQDPRTSEVGLAWMLNSTNLKNLDFAAAKKLPKKTFPSWSSSFKAFESGLAPAIWTYSTSAAYFQCNHDANAKNLVNLPLPGYPKDRNYIAAVQHSKEADAFIALVLSREIQAKVWEKNWMTPANAQEQKKLPECFSKVWLPKDAKKVGSTNQQKLVDQLDQWSL